MGPRGEEQKAGLIGEQRAHPPPLRQRHRERDRRPLPVPGGQLPRVGVDVALRVRKVNQVKKIQCPRAVVVSWKVTVRTQHLTDLSADAQSRVEGVSRIPQEQCRRRR